jgi:hypothetical protein
MHDEGFVGRVALAFSSRPYPEEGCFFKAISDRDYGYSALAVDGRKEWIDVSVEDLVKYYDFIFFLDEFAQVYYFPAYIKNIIENNYLMEASCMEAFLMVISGVRCELLSCEEVSVIYDFLIFCKSCVCDGSGVDEVLLSSAILRVETCIGRVVG